MSSTPFVVALDPVAARHLALALDVHGRWARANGYQLPPALAALRVALAAEGGQAGTDVPPPAGVGEPPPVALTFDQAGRRLGVSGRTVRRLVAGRRLPAMRVGSCARIHRDDLDAYADALRAGGVRKSTSQRTEGATP